MEFSELAAEKFRRLDKAVKDRIARQLQTIAQEPARYLARLSSVEAYKLRVGDYRVIVDVDWERKTMLVLTLGHRSAVYG